MAKGKGDNARDKSVLGGAVDESAALENCSDGKNCAGRDLSGACVDCAQDVVGGVVDA